MLAYYFAITDTASGTVLIDALRRQILAQTVLTKPLRNLSANWNAGTIIARFEAALSPAEEAALNAVVVAHTGVEPANIQQLIKDRLTSDLLSNITVTAVVTGLIITTNIEGLVVDDVTTVVASTTNTKYVRLSYVYNESTDTFSVEAYEKTTGEYALYTPPEYLVRELGEWYVVANGVVLVKV